MSEEKEILSPEGKEKQAEGTVQVMPDFAEGASDSAQVLPIPEPVRSGKGARDTEFIVGAAVLSAVGGVFLLTALVLVWINYMNSFAKGMSMYFLAALVMCVSELLIRKHWLKLSYVLTSVGIGGFYVSTMVNCRWLNHFPEAAGMSAIAVFSVLVLLYGWKRDVPWYRIESLLAFYLCLAFGSAGPGDKIYFMTIALGMAVGLFGALLPLKRQTAAVTVTSMLTIVLLFEVPVEVTQLGMIQGMLYCMGALPVLSLLLYRQLDFFRVESQRGAAVKTAQEVGNILCFAFYLVSLFFLYLHFSGAALGRSIFSTAQQFCLIGVLAACLLSFAILRKYREKWTIYYLANIFAYTVYITMEVRDGDGPGWGGRGEGFGWGGWCLVILLLLAEVLALRKERELKASQAILTAVACITVVVVSDQAYVYALLAVLLCGVLSVNHWHAYYELMVTYTIAWFVTRELPTMLSLPVFVGILFVGILLVNNVKRLRGARPLVYNWGVLAGQILAYLYLILPWYGNLYLTYFCMLVFGLSIIILILREKYQLNCRCKLLVTELFLAYLVLTLRLRPTILTSIFLMGIALVGVGGGFWLRQKSARICGLVFSLLVCGKIVLYDFRGGSTLQRIILFLVTGVIALVIGGIYIVLEKKMRERQVSQSTGGGE